MSDVRLKEFAAALDEAALTRRALVSGSSGLTGIDDAYAVQEALVARRLERGERITGFKLGFTSVAKMRQMGVHDLIHGRITDRMRIADGGTFDAGTLIHPRVEPEVAFLLGGPLGPGTVDPLDAVAAVAPALEIIDSRYDGFTFSLPEVIADNTSAAGYALGAWRSPLELGNLGVLLELDGRLAEAGSTAAVLGHPLRALAAAARLAPPGALVAGTVVLAGAATAAVPLAAGVHVRATVSGLGTVGFATVPEASGGRATVPDEDTRRSGATGDRRPGTTGEPLS
ncbi:2-keto-4-pentenoate hydratase [Streptomyces sp. NPDC004111]|uniref:2-keto-4-pentenoate hydratase n=1 Tax=Streptomyces sp. NPDC004111 TaxID=3364690 RepID=UPI003685D140